MCRSNPTSEVIPLNHSWLPKGLLGALERQSILAEDLGEDSIQTLLLDTVSYVTKALDRVHHLRGRHQEAHRQDGEDRRRQPPEKIASLPGQIYNEAMGGCCVLVCAIGPC